MDLETANTWRRQLDVKTEHLNIDTVKNILTVIRTNTSKKTFEIDDTVSAHAVEIAEKLMSHLKHGLLTIEEQSICSLTYCSTLNLMTEENAGEVLQNICVILSSFQQTLYTNNRDSQSSLSSCEYSRKHNTMIIGLINGIFKSDSVRISGGLKLQEVSDSIVVFSFKIITKLCLLYSNVTFHSFKTLHVMLEKIIVWGTVDKIMAADMDRIIVFVISSNWENSISGVREINSKILKTFRILMDAQNNRILDIIKDVTMTYPWNRAKYLILCEVLPDLRNDETFKALQLSRDGLKLSLHCSSLVSAGSSLYKTMISKITIDMWRERFFELFTNNMLSKERSIQTNILNHWLFPTLKSFPEVFDILLNVFVEKSLSDNEYYALLHILKIGRKTGLIFTSWSSITEREMYFKDKVRSGLDHIDEDVRSQAFQVVCNTHQFSVISEEECEIVKNFLTMNINYNSTSFCNSCINAFTVVFIRLIESFLYLIKNIETASKCDECRYVEQFFIWVHEFILQNLQRPGNYHRKIFSLHINEIVLRYLHPAEHSKRSVKGTRHTKNGSYRKAPNLTKISKIGQYLENKSEWRFQERDNILALIKCINDAADDVRELATSILIGHYSDKILQLKEVTDGLFIDGLELCNSRMFYEMESGCLMFKIITSLSEQPKLPLEDCSNLVEYLIKKSINQFELQKSDLLLSIYNNKPLYGLISALKMTIKHSNDSYSMSDTTLQTLLALSNSITEHYLDILACKCDNDGRDYPPSFAEMSDSIEYVIGVSAYRYDARDRGSDLHISNAHHLVLNNIWLNLDASCGLSCTLLQNYVIRMDTKTVGDCLKMITSVLTRCRHKGAIEHAGVTLGIAIRHLTSLGNSEINNLISSMLRDFLIQATSANENHSGSITRKSAGFTILVDKIISNDSREEKPLFYLAMDILLSALKSWRMSSKLDCIEISFRNDDLSNERDIPLAIALHLLCRTVANSSLASYVVQFASELTTVCFDHLTSDQWQVRNAALQLYGALVPKLIGQRSGQGEETCPVSPYELFVHVPTLWDHIRTSLRAMHEEKSSKTILESHSNLVPVLSLLSSMARRQNYYQFCESACSRLNIAPVLLEDIFGYICELLSSPIYAVRNISAKIIQSYYSLRHFYEHFRSKMDYSENELHGYLMTIKCYVLYYNSFLDKYLFSSSESLEWYNIITSISSNIFAFIKNSSYPVKTLVLEIKYLLQESVYFNSSRSGDYIDLAKNSIEAYNGCVNNPEIQIGVYQWINFNATFSISACKENDLIKIVEIFFNSENVELIENVCMVSLKDRLKNNTLMKHSYKSLCEIIIQSNVIKSVGKNTFRVLYMSAVNIPVSEKFWSSRDFDVLYSSLNVKEDSKNIYNQGYLLPLLCLMKCDSSDDTLLRLSNACRKLSKPDTNDSEHRYIAATSINHLANTVFSMKNENILNNYDIKVNIIISSILLLQDENSDIRNRCSKISFGTDKSLLEFVHPNVRLKNILNREFLLKVFDRSPTSAVVLLRTVLNEIPTREVSSADDLQNPFDHNTSNTYWEPELMSEIITNLIHSHANDI